MKLKSGRKCTTCSTTKLAKVSIGFGAFFFIFGLALAFGFTHFLDYMTIKMSKMIKGSHMSESWEAQSADAKIYAYVWHVQNSEEILRDPEAKVHLQDKGPYVYRMHLGFSDVQWSEDDLYISYKRFPHLEFLPDESNGTDEDYAVGINFPLITIGHMLQSFTDRGWSGYFIKQGVRGLLRAYPDNEILVNRTVKDFLFGYQSCLHRMFKSNELSQFMKMDGGTPEFGILSRFHNRDDGLFKMYTGVDDVGKRGNLYSWKNQTSLKNWNTKSANTINGSDGVIHPPFVKADSKLYYFMPHLHRSLPLEMTGHSVVRGVPAYRFSEPRDVLNYSLVKHREFCTPDSSNCPRNGLLNMSGPNFGAPVMSSRPHFVDADPEILKRFTGVHPDRSHVSFYDIHPRLGVSLRGEQAIQINVHITPTEGFGDLDKWPETVFPSLWFKQVFEIKDDVASAIRAVAVTEMIMPVVQYVLISLGVVMVTVGACFVCWRNRQKIGSPHCSQTQTSKVYDQEVKPVQGLSSLPKSAQGPGSSESLDFYVAQHQDDSIVCRILKTNNEVTDSSYTKHINEREKFMSSSVVEVPNSKNLKLNSEASCDHEEEQKLLFDENNNISNVCLPCSSQSGLDMLDIQRFQGLQESVL